MSDLTLNAAFSLAATLPAGAIAWGIGRTAERFTTAPAVRSSVWSGAVGLTLAAAATPLLQHLRLPSERHAISGVSSIEPYAAYETHTVAPAWLHAILPFSGMIVGVAAVGAVISLTVLALRLARLNAIRRRSIPAPNALAALIQTCNSDLKIPPVRVSAEATTAMLTGVRYPMIVLPEALVQTLSPEALGWVCAHELAHFRRGDHLWASLDRMIAAVFWFNPFLTATLRRRADVHEVLCDAIALSGASPAQRRRYAETLMQALRFSGPDSPQPAFTPRKGPGNAMRLKSILNPVKKPSRGVIGLTAGLAIAGTLSVAAVSAALAQQLAAVGKAASGNNYLDITIESDRAEQIGGKASRIGNAFINEGERKSIYTGSPRVKASASPGYLLIMVDGLPKPEGFDVSKVPADTIKRIEKATKGTPEAKAMGATSPDQTVIAIFTKTH